MKSRVVFMALLCLLFVFQGVFAASAPVVQDLTYNGTDQPLAQDSGTPDDGYAYWFRLQSDTSGAWSQQIPTAKDAGTYVLEYLHTNVGSPAAEAGPTNRREVKIQKAEVTVTWPDGPSRTVTYNGEEQAPEPTVTGILEGDSCTWDYTEDKPKDAVDNKEITITFSGDSCANYTLAESYSTRFTILPAVLTIEWNEDSFEAEYDGEAHHVEASIVDGCVPGEESICDALLAYSGEGINVGNYPTTVSIDPAAEGAGNYKLDPNSVTEQNLFISPKELTLIWDGLEEAPEIIEKTYNGEEQTLTAELAEGSSFLPTDSCEIVVSGSATNVADGIEYVSAEFVGVSGDNEQCSFNYATGQWAQAMQIVPIQLTVSYDGAEFTYDDDYHPHATVVDQNGDDVEQYNGEAPIYLLNDRKKDANTAEEPSYTAKFAVMNDNYVLAEGQQDEWKFVINPADPEYVEPEPLDEDTLSCTGSVQTLLKSTGSAVLPENGRWIFFSTYTDPDGASSDPEKFVSTSPVGTDAGTYSITWYFYNNENRNYKSAGSPEEPLGSTVVTIVKDPAKLITDPLAVEGLEFDDNPKTLITEGEAEGGTILYFLEGEEPSEELPTGINAGDYDVYYYVQGDDIHSDLGSVEEPFGPVTVTIAKAPAFVDTAPVPYSGDYDEAEHELLTDPGTTTDGTFMYKLDDGEYSENIPTATNAGEYVISYYVVGDENHTDSEEAQVTAVINKIDPVLVTKPMNTDPVYNGEAQELVTPGEYEGGTIMYFLMGDEPSENVPSATDAGKYPVYYYVIGDENHNDLDVEGTHRYAGVTSIISPLTVTITPDELSKVFGDEDPELTYTVDPTEPAAGFTGSLSRKDGEDVGEYAVTQGDLALDEASQNNFALEFVEDVKFQITKAESIDIAAPVPFTDLVYNGSAQDLLETLAVPSDETAVVVYQIGSATTEGNPNAINAGEYEIEYYIKEDDNHSEIHNDSWVVTAKIAKAPVSVTWMVGGETTEGTSQTLPYDGAEHAITFTAIADDGADTDVTDKLPPSVTKDGESFSDAIIPVGTYVVELTPEDGFEDNYELNSEDTTFTLTITKAPVTVTVTGEEVTADYDGEVHTVAYNMEITSDESGTYDLDYVSFLGTVYRIDETDAGEYELTLSADDFENINENFEVTFDVTSGKLTINPAEVTVILKGVSNHTEYDGEVHGAWWELVSILVNGDYTNLYGPADFGPVDGAVVTIAEKNAGLYTLTLTPDMFENKNVKEDGTSNFNVSFVFDPAEFELEITKKTVTLTWNSESEFTYNAEEQGPTAENITIEGLAAGEEQTEVATITVTGSPMVDAGEYTAVAEVTFDPDNYELAEDAQTEFAYTIGKAKPVITKRPVMVPDLVYNGEPQVLITAGEVENGTLMYFVEGKEPSEELPKETDAGNYNVYFYVVGDENYDDLDDTDHKYDVVSNAAIAKAQVKVTPDEGQFKYFDEEDPELTYTFTPESPAPEFTGKLSRKEGEEVGTYNIWAGDLALTEESAKNFEYDPNVDFTYNVQFEIRNVPAELEEAPTAKSGLVYEGNGVYQALLETLGKAKGGEIWYQLSRDGKTWDAVNTNPGADWAGDYTITYFIKGDDNHSDVTNEEWVLEVTIEKAVITVTPDAGQTKEVGTEDPDPLTFSSDGWKASDPHKLVGKLSREEGEPMGEYEITIGTLELGPDEVLQHNYDLEVVPGVMFEITPSHEEVEVVISGNEETYEYTGDEISMEKVFQLVNEPKGIIESDITCSGTVSRTDKGTEEAELSTLGCEVNSPSYPNAYITIEDGAKAVLTITAASISEDDFVPPQAKTMPYNGSEQELIEPGSWNGVIKGVFQYKLSDYVAAKAPEYPTEFSTTIPVGDDAGTYSVEWKIVPLENYDRDGEILGDLESEITQVELTEDMIQIQKVVYYTGEEQQVQVLVYLNGNLVPETEYEIAEGSQISGTEPGTYTVTINGLSPNFTGSVNVQWRIIDTWPNRMDLFYVGEPGSRIPTDGSIGQLPATGFPTRVNVPLSVKPEGLNYTNLGMRIQIPVLNVDVELAGVPTMEGAWKVEWLEDRAGLLSGTSLPGEGYSIVAAHNTLNAEEVGPFVMLSTLKINDTVFVNTTNGELKLFRVFANELLEPNDMVKLASIAEQEENTLVLVTCENESADGGYLNRRVVFAKPLN